MKDVIKVLMANKNIDTAHIRKNGYITVIPDDTKSFRYLGGPLKDFEIEDEDEKGDYLIAGKYYDFRGASNFNTTIYEITIKEVEI